MRSGALWAFGSDLNSYPPLEGQGRLTLSGAKCETGWGDLSTRALFEGRDCHPTPPLISFASTLPLQGRVRRVHHSLRIKLARPARTRRLDVQRTGAFVLALAFRERRTAMPANAHRYFKRLAGRVAALLISRETDDVLGRSYLFFNPCCPPGL